jgi:alpha-D-ribose 1-methylphosphonate 5-triphosphate diphosphatase PhnM
LVAAVIKIAGNVTGDIRWKVPGVMNWATMTHNPFVDVTKDTTTLDASDRDVFLFLVDDTNPIEAGRQMDRRICISEAFTSGTAKSAARRLGLRVSIFAPSA